MKEPSLNIFLVRWLALVFFGLAVYAQSFGFGFVFDDHFFILDNSYIKSWAGLSQIWSVLPKTRLVGIYSLALNYHFNQLDPQGYHIFNFLVHLAAVGLAWALASKLFEITGRSSALAFFVAALFLVHPCQTQAAAYISQRFESMAAVFYLASVYLYICGRTGPRNQNFFLAGCLICALLGLLTKETAMTIPLMLLAVEWIILDSGVRRETNRPLYLIFGILSLGIIFLVVKIVRFNLINEFFRYSVPSESHQGDIISAGKYLLTQMRVFLTLMRILVFPVGQNADYDYPLSTGLLQPPLTLAGLGLIGLIVYLIVKWRRRRPLIAFGMAWILIAFSINCAPRNNVIFEHKLYLISFGFFLCVVAGLSELIKERRLLNGVFIFLVAVLALTAYKRVQVWENDLTLWSDVIKKSPHKARAYNAIGVALAQDGLIDQALPFFNKAIALDPSYAVAYNNRGNAYSKLGDYMQAGADLNKAIALQQDYLQAYNNLVDTYEKAGGHFSGQK